MDDSRKHECLKLVLYVNSITTGIQEIRVAITTVFQMNIEIYLVLWGNSSFYETPRIFIYPSN